MCASITASRASQARTAHFTVHTTDRFGRRATFEARKLAISIGYYDLPNWMGIPGETLSKVHHYYHDPHPYFGMDVAVIGGKNSAAIAALELWRQRRARYADLPRSRRFSHM